MWSVGMWMNVYDEKTMFNELEMVDDVGLWGAFEGHNGYGRNFE